MKKNIKYYAYSLIMLCLCACSEGKNNTIKTEVNCDSVSFATISLHDTINYAIGNDENCHISANVILSYPKMYVNKERTDVLQELFASSVLGITEDSITLATAFPQYKDKLIARYKESEENYDTDVIELDYDLMTDCRLSVKTFPVYNRGGLLCFCKQETAVINGKKPSVRHYYYAFDLNKMRQIGLSDLFQPENNDKVVELLKDKFRYDMNVSSNDELAYMGYYNFDNMVLTENFYITSDSIVWNYLPRELSVLDEVRISLSRNAIELLSDNN